MAAMPDTFDLAAGEPTEVRILVTLATLAARQDEMIRVNEEARAAALAQHREVMGRFDTFVPRAEIELKDQAIHGRIDALDERVRVLESRMWKAIAGILSAIGTAVAGVFGIHVRSG
jgi:hypothetical protein